MAYNNQQQSAFWDYVRSTDNNNNDNHGAGVDQPAQSTFPPGAGAFGFGFPANGMQGGFPFGGAPHFGPIHGFGSGPCGGRGRRGRHCSRSREGNQEGRAASPGGEGEHGPEEGGEHTEGSPPAYPHWGRGFGHHGRGRGGRGGHRHGPPGSHGHGPHGHGPHGHRGPHGPPPPPPFGGEGMFDLNALLGSLAQHPLAQAFRSFAAQAAAQQSGETLIPEEFDADSTFTPPIDVFSTETAFILHVSLPGAKKEDVGVNWDAEKGVLNLAGVVYRQGDEAFLKSLSQSERKVGVFERTVKLPPGTGSAEKEKEEVDGDGITAKLEDGVLVVTVPKVEKEWTEVKRVDIQ